MTIDEELVGDEETFGVWRENWGAVRAFLECRTQWRAAVGLGIVWLGLDYASCDVVLRRGDHDDQIFADLREMEEAALEVMNRSE